MKSIQDAISKARRPVQVLQFGEGNFLRGFADHMIDIANEKGVTDMSVAVVKPIPFGSAEPLRRQDCVYTVLLRGLREGRTYEEARVVTAVDRIVDSYAEYGDFMALARLESLRLVISNTTEAGIAHDPQDAIADCPPRSFPAKLTKFLYERYTAFSGDREKGLVLLPVELIEENGRKLRECVLHTAESWGLPQDFLLWLREANLFCSTLVDRIVTGYPKDEERTLWEALGYRDELMVAGEPFGLWVIESERPEAVRALLPLDRAGLPVVFTRDLSPYRERKVRVLNGAHTGTVPAAFLAGLDTVGECMADPVVRAYMERLVFDEIVPTVRLPREEADAFARAVMERFENPFIRHRLLSISLNSVSKWKTRVLPSLLDSLHKTGRLPELLTFSFSALLAFYSGGGFDGERLTGLRNGEGYPIRDDGEILRFFEQASRSPAGDYVRAVAASPFWGTDLTSIGGFCEKAEAHLSRIRASGARAAMQTAVKEADANG